MCSQEVRATLKDMAKDGTMENPAGLTGYWHLAERPGYSGVGIWTPHVPKQMTQGIGHPDFDAEGRYLELDLGKVVPWCRYTCPQAPVHRNAKPPSSISWMSFCLA